MATLADLEREQGEGWHASNPVPKMDADNVPIPGTYTVALAGPNGAQRIVTIYAPAPLGPTVVPNLIETDPQKATFDKVGVEETVKPPTQTAAETDARIAEAQAAAANAKALADKYAADLVQTQKDNANRDANQQVRGYWVTDKELADITARGNEQKLTQDQINNQLKIASDNNSVSRESNAISAQNAATNAFVAQKNAEAQAAQVQAVISGQGLDQAKFTREQADRDIANRIAEDKLSLEQLQQRQAAQIAERQAATSEQSNVLRGQELAQRGEEAKQTAETAALGQGAQAAATAYSAEKQAQQQAATTGGNLLQNRAASFQNLSQAPFTQAANLSQGSAGRYGMLGGGLHAVPEGAVQNIMQGAMGVSTGLYGGQGTLDAARQMIEAARPGAAMSPMGQAAAAMIAQIQERAQAILKGGQVNAPNTAGPAAATATPATAAVTAPVTQPTGAFQGQDIQQLMRNQMEQHLNPQQAIAAPVTAPFQGQDIQQLMAQQMRQHQPTININL